MLHELTSRGRVRGRRGTLRRCCSSSRLPPRARSARSRAWPAAAAARPFPGKLLSTVDPGAVDRLAARLERGSVLVSATNGKTTTTAMVAEILGGRLAYNHSGANLLSGVASTLLSSRGAELGLFEVDEAALPEVARRVRPRVVALGNLFRDQLDRYGELEHVAERWRAIAAELPETLSRRERRRPAARRARPRPRARRSPTASTIRGMRRGLAPARGRLDVLPRLRRAVRVRRGLRRAPRRLPLPERPRRPAPARRRRARDRAARARRDGRSRLETPDGVGARPARAARPLQRLQRDRGGGDRGRARGAARGDRRGPRRFTAAFGRFERIDGRRPKPADAADQEPGRRERGGAHAARRQLPHASRSSR